MEVLAIAIIVITNTVVLLLLVYCCYTDRTRKRPTTTTAARNAQTDTVAQISYPVGAQQVPQTGAQTFHPISMGSLYPLSSNQTPYASTSTITTEVDCPPSYDDVVVRKMKVPPSGSNGMGQSDEKLEKRPS